MKIDNNQQKSKGLAIALMLIIGMSLIIPMALTFVRNFDNQNNRYVRLKGEYRHLKSP